MNSSHSKHHTLQDAWHASPGPKTIQDGFILYGKGVLMGIADLIPGVSGGTIAFITGIYDELLEATASIGLKSIRYLIKFQIKELLTSVHIRFIIPLLFGILTSIFSLARLMHFMMNEHAVETWGFFLGLIIASIIVIFRDLKRDNLFLDYSFLILGAIFAYIVVGLIPVTTPDALWFIYLCGIIGITAMILPGISGSFLLLILGKYEYITGLVKDPFGPGNFSTLVIFACGTVTGLLGFTKILNFFIKRYNQFTMYFLTGVLVGSLRKIWPWKEVLQSEMIGGKLRILRDQNVLPQYWQATDWICILMIILGFFAVIGLDLQMRKKSQKG